MDKLPVHVSLKVQKKKKIHIARNTLVFEPMGQIGLSCLLLMPIIIHEVKLITVFVSRSLGTGVGISLTDLFMCFWFID